MKLNDEHKVCKILIVDDNQDIHKDFKTILNPPQPGEVEQLEAEIFGQKLASSRLEYNYELHFASQGQEALELVRRSIDHCEPFQLAFVDIRMPPGWDGVETIEQLWAVDEHLQVVLCSAYSDYSWEKINTRLQHTQNLLYLKKPFDISEVAQMASTMTRKWMMTKAALAKQSELETIVQKRTEELHRINQRLKAEVEARRELSKQLIRAQKMEAIGTLAAGVAHDLNNILSGIVSYPELVMLSMRPQDPNYAKLELIQQTGLKAAAIVQDMLTLSRRAVSQQEEVDLGVVVDDYLKSPEWVKIKNLYTHINIETDISAGLSRVIGAKSQIAKSLMNLVSNAAEAMPKAGTITISTKECTLDKGHDGYELIPAGKYVLLSVADTGDGIENKDLEHIFEPFYTKKVMGRSGTGLGLAVVWGVVHDHEGYLDITSTPGVGTHIDLYFPDSGKKENPAPPPSLASPAKGKGDYILVVDDVHEQRQIAMEMLRLLGYKTDAVASGEAALLQLGKKHVDLLLLDMCMDNGIDGMETYKRALKINPKQRAIIASGFTKNERVEGALSLGASALLQKPYSLNLLAETIKKALKNTGL